MKTNTVLVLFFALMLNSLFGQTLKWAGCDVTRMSFMAEAAKVYQEEKGVQILLNAGGDLKGIGLLAQGTSDMAGTCRPAVPEYLENEAGLFHTVVAWDAIVPIVNYANPVNSLTIIQLQNILLGKIKNWSELGGPDQKINLIVRDSKFSGVDFMVYQLILENINIDISPDATILKSSAGVELNIETEKWAIGISGISSVIKRNIKTLAVNNVEPTNQNIIAGKYPYFRPLYILTKGKPEGDTKKFLDWLISDKGQRVVKKSGSITLAEGSILKGKYKHWGKKEMIANFEQMP